MQLESDYIDLFKETSTAIKDVIAIAGDSIWNTNYFRQVAFDVHSQTKSIIYAWTDFVDYGYITTEVLIDKHRDELAEQVWKSAEKIRQHFGDSARIGRLMLARLPAGCKIREHADSANLTLIHRCHHVIQTNDKVDFKIGNRVYNFTEGSVFDFNNMEMHSVDNRGDTDRIHLICDIKV